MMRRTRRHWHGTLQKAPPSVVSISVLSLSIVMTFVPAGRALSTGTTLMMPTPIGIDAATWPYDSKACLWNKYDISGCDSLYSLLLASWNSKIPGANGTSR